MGSSTIESQDFDNALSLAHAHMISCEKKKQDQQSDDASVQINMHFEKLEGMDNFK